jgi:outer membrane protein assembly factor BamB
MYESETSSMSFSSRFNVFLVCGFLACLAPGMIVISPHLGTTYATASSSSDNNWSQSGYDPQHRCVNPTEHTLNPSNVSSLKLAWSYTAGGDVSNGEAVANGLAYVTSYNGTLYSLNAKTGALKWSYATGSSIQLDTPAAANGLVYFGTESGNLYALDALTGTLKWRYNTGGSIYDSPTIANGILYIGAGTTLYALDAKTRALKWSFAPGTGYGNFSSPMVYHGMVYAGTDNQDVFALNMTSGKVIWHQTVNSSVYASPSAMNGIVYASTGAGGRTVYAFDAGTGTLKWHYTIGGEGGFAALAALYNGMVLIGSNDRGLYALNATTGKLIWRYLPAGGSGDFFNDPAVGNGVLYVGSSNMNFYAFHLPR